MRTVRDIAALCEEDMNAGKFALSLNMIQTNWAKLEHLRARIADAKKKSDRDELDKEWEETVEGIEGHLKRAAKFFEAWKSA